MLIYSYFLTRKSYFHSIHVYQEPTAFADDTGHGPGIVFSFILYAEKINCFTFILDVQSYPG